MSLNLETGDRLQLEVLKYDERQTQFKADVYCTFFKQTLTSQSSCTIN